MTAITPPPAPEVIAQMMGAAISGAIDNTARSLQKEGGVLGPSDIGFCRNKAALVTKQVPPSDTRRTLMSAAVGSAMHEYFAPIFREAFPSWIVEKARVTCVLPNGVEMTGTADIVVPEWNLVIDEKSVDGFAWVRREGASQNNKFQRFMYADGACRAGLLDRDKPVYVANVYFDRSGGEMTPHIEMEEVDWSLADQIASWVDDVIYAVQHNEDAPRDKPAAVCEKICEFYTVCRGGLPADDTEFIDDPEVLAAVDMYVAARETKKVADQEMDAAKAVLTGLNASTGKWQIRTTHVAPSERKAYSMKGYDKVEVVAVRGANR